MKDAHLTQEDLGRLLEDDGEEIRNRIFLHHLAVCPECHAIGGHILDAYLAGEVGIDLCTIDIDLSISRRIAPTLWTELEPLSPDRRMKLIGEDKRFRSWGLAEFLCRKSEEEAAREPEWAIQIAELAVEVSMIVKDWCPTEDSWLCELRGYAWAHLSNAHRAMGDFRKAAAAFLKAEEWWSPAFANAGNVLDYEARFLALKASLFREQRRFDEALRALEEATAARPTPEVLVRILINKAKTYEELGDMDEAIRLLDEARHVPVADSDVRVRLCLTQNFLDYLSKEDRFIDAERALPEVRAVVTELGSELDRLRLRWTEARITAGLGRTEEAIGLFQDVRGELVDRHLGFDAALISLELALSMTRAGFTADMKTLAAEALPIFEAQQVDRETLGALALFREAVDLEQVTPELISQMLACFRRLRSGGQP